MSVSDLVGGGIGVLLSGLGIASVVASSLRGRRSDRVLLFFGTWCALYGLRLLADTPFVVETLGVPTTSAAYFRAFVTYTINVPIVMSVESVIGPGWKQWIRRLWQVQAVYAVGAIATDVLLQRPRAAMALNSPLVLFAAAIGLANLWKFRNNLSATLKSRAIGGAAVILLLCVVNENVGRPVFPDINLEPVGVLVFIVALGYGVVTDMFRRETELVAVQREMETARQIQTSLLPRTLPDIHRLDVAARYLPMTAVAGDIYDFITLGPSRVGLLVADVSGHGVPAALVASMVKLAFAAQSDDANDPALVLTGINRILCRHVESTFVTAVYAVIDTDRRTITVANAGHPPLLAGGPAGAVRESSAHGLMLGMVSDAVYTNDSLHLGQGEYVVLYTDGIPETQNPGGDFLDLDRVRTWLTSGDGQTAARFADTTLENLRSWRGGNAFDDDVTLVVARFA